MQQIAAILYEVGKKPQLIVVDLADLHSPKASISQSDARYLRALKGVASTKLPPIEVQALGDMGQKSTVPLAQVALDP